MANSDIHVQEELTGQTILVSITAVEKDFIWINVVGNFEKQEQLRCDFLTIFFNNKKQTWLKNILMFFQVRS